MRPMHERMERELFAEFSQKYGAPATPNTLVRMPYSHCYCSHVQSHCYCIVVVLYIIYPLVQVAEEPAFRRRSATRSRPISTLSTRPLTNRPESFCSSRPPSTNEPTIR